MPRANTDTRARAAAEQVQESERALVIQGSLKLVQHALEGNTRHRQISTDAIDHEDADRQQDLVTELLDMERVGNTFEHD